MNCCEDCKTRVACIQAGECAREEELNAPTGMWEICPHCDGEGSHSKRFGAMTMSEFEDCFDDEESQEAYFAGAYDEPCDACGGSGKIKDTEENREKLRRARERERICLTGRNDAGEPMW